MKFQVLATLVFLTLPALSTEHVNFLSCYYTHETNGWRLEGVSSNEAPVRLAVDDVLVINAAWTSDKIIGPEFAVCNEAVGTTDDQQVTLKSYWLESDKFRRFSGRSCEDIEGQNIRLVSQKKESFRRGEFSEMRTSWLPPDLDELIVRTYFPKLDEVTHLPDLWQSKCAELLPRN